MSSCNGTTSRVTDFYYPASLFSCLSEPGPWAEDASDAEITINEALRTAAGRDCRYQLRTACDVIEANGQLNGKCE